MAEGHASEGRQIVRPDLGANDLLDQLVGLGNTKLGNEYIFAGGAVDAPPFLAAGAYVGDTNVRQLEVDAGIKIDTNHTGDQLLGSAIIAVQALVTELQTGTGASIGATATALFAADADVLGSQSEVGLRIQELNWSDRHMARRTAAALDLREEIELADPATPVRRKLVIRLRRAFRFLGTTGLLMLAVCFLVALAALLYFGLPVIAQLLFGEAV